MVFTVLLDKVPTKTLLKEFGFAYFEKEGRKLTFYDVSDSERAYILSTLRKNEFRHTVKMNTFIENSGISDIDVFTDCKLIKKLHSSLTDEDRFETLLRLISEFSISYYMYNNKVYIKDSKVSLGNNGHNGKYRFWDKKEIKEMFKLKEKGLTCKEIGKRLGRSSKSVEHKYYRDSY